MKISKLLVAPLLVAPILASCGGSTEYKVNIPEVEGVTVYPKQVKKGENYLGTIEILSEYTNAKLLPDKLDKVTSGNKALQPTEYTYTPKEDKVSAEFKIPAANIVGDIDIQLTPIDLIVERTVSFNIPDCKMYYGTTEISKDGTKIKIPNESPFKTKFSVKANDETLMKPSKVTLDKELEYTFNKDNGDLEINLSSDVSVTGTSDIYKSLEECTWAQIKTISESGKASTIFHIGEEKTVTLLQDGAAQSFAHVVRIIDFDHDDDPSGKKIGITFEFKNIITNNDKNPYMTEWNGDFSEKTGDATDYRTSKLNTILNNMTLDGSIINRLPEDLKGVIKQVDKKVGVYDTSWSAKGFDGEEHPYPYLFPLAYKEICTVENSYVVANEGTLYQYYQGHSEDTEADKEYRKKFTVDCDDGGASPYWLRSPSTYSNIDAFNVRQLGEINYMLSCYSRMRLAPAFCI